MLSLPLDDTARMRALEPWNAAEFAAFTERNREFLAPWLPWATSVVDPATARAFLGRYAERQAADAGRIYGIWDGPDLVGGTLFRVFDTASGVCELGVWLAPEATGRGLVTRAARHMIDWAVGERGMSKVEWLCAVDNLASRAVASRLGMTCEGTMRKAFPINGTRVDIQRWAILAEEWPGG
jgi:ribosomal-protein-serine acetyltransferase